LIEEIETKKYFGELTIEVSNERVLLMQDYKPYLSQRPINVKDEKYQELKVSLKKSSKESPSFSKICVSFQFGKFLIIVTIIEKKLDAEEKQDILKNFKRKFFIIVTIIENQLKKCLEISEYKIVLIS
jgi:hypothetical protein